MIAYIIVFVIFCNRPIIYIAKQVMNNTLGSDSQAYIHIYMQINACCSPLGYMYVIDRLLKMTTTSKLG